MKHILERFKFLSALFFIFIFYGCGSSGMKSLENNPSFTITQAYYQNWIAGVKGGGSGTNVHIIFENLSADITIQDIYFRNKKEKAQRSSENKNEYVSFFKSELNEAEDIIMDINPQKEAKNTPPQNSPFDLKPNEAVVSYLDKGKIKFYKFSELKEKKTVDYPQSRKDN